MRGTLVYDELRQAAHRYLRRERPDHTLQSAALRVLYGVPAGVGWVSSIVPSPDGHSLAFTRRMFVHDVMLLENF